MSNLLKSLRDFILSLLGLQVKPPEPFVPSLPETVSEIPMPPVPPVKEEEGEDEEEVILKDPIVSSPSGSIGTCLWKPVSDHSNTPVVLVSCECIRSTDLHMEIIGKGGKVLKVKIANTGRANKSPNHVFGRIHFRPARSKEKFVRSAPLKLRFFQYVKGEKVIVKVVGKEFFTVKNPTRRAGS